MPFWHPINILARVVARAPWTVSSLDIRRDLHWLPVSHRITFKLCLLTWKTLHTAHPPYPSELITHYLPPRALRSSNTNLFGHTGITTNFTPRPFCFRTVYPELTAYTHPLSWQIVNLQTSTKVSSLPVRFCRLVTLCIQRLRFVLRFWRYINQYVCT